MPVELFKKAYHFTHVDNLADIVRHGGLLSHNLLREERVAYTDISDASVQHWRQRPEPVFGRPIHDYVPLYLNPRNPMLYRLHGLSPELVMLAVEIDRDCPAPRVFADGNAACRDTRFGDRLEAVGPAQEALCASSWSWIPDGKRLRCAEMLVPDRISLAMIDGIYCMNDSVRAFAQRILGRAVQIDRSLYFA